MTGLAPAARHIAYSCVVDGHPRFLRQGQNLVLSLLAVGVAPDQIHVNLTEAAAAYAPAFEGLGCQTHRIPHFGDGRYCNKIMQLRTAPRSCDWLVCCDTDTLFLRNIEADIAPHPGVVAGKTVDFDNPPLAVLRRLAALRGLADDLPLARSDINDAPTLAGNFNGGLYVLPGPALEAFSAVWEAEALALNQDPRAQAALGAQAWHSDQIGFCFALHKTGLPYRALPLTFNLPLHVPLPREDAFAPDDVRILHYHDAVDENGLPEAQKARSPGLKQLVSDAAESLRTLHDRAHRAARDRTAQARRLTLVAGFHRSGTSLLTAGCAAIGYSLGNGPLLGASFDNPNGYFENRRAIRINEEILGDLGSDWDDIFLSYGGAPDAVAARYTQTICTFLEREFLLDPDSRFVLKDPRLLQTYGIWRHAAERMGLGAPDLLFILRNPLECAESQRARSETAFAQRGDPFHIFGADLRETLLLWYVCTYRFLASLRGERLKLVRYADLMGQPDSCLTGVADWAGLDPSSTEIARFTGSFLQKDLRHHSRSVEELRAASPEFPFIADLFEALDALPAHTPPAADHLRRIVLTHAEHFGRIAEMDFLGRLFVVPKRHWTQSAAHPAG